MHVLMVAEHLPPDIGGVERHVAGLARELIQWGIELTLVAPTSDRQPSISAKKNKLRIIRIPRYTFSSRDYIYAWRWWLARRSLLNDIDLIHFHDVYTMLHWFGPAHLLAPTMPRFLTFHGYEMRFPIPRRAKFYRRLAGMIASASICVGHYLVKWFRIQPQIITYGAATLPQEPPPTPSAPAAAFVGRLAPDTGLDIYLKGLGLLRRQHKVDISIFICGEGPLRSALVELARREQVRATFIGPVSDPGPFVSQASMVFSSGYLSMLEAMAFRRPVFSVFHSPVKYDYLKQMPGAGELFSISSSPEQLAAEVMSHLSKNNNGISQVERAYDFAAQQSWSKLAGNYIELWNQN